MCCLCVEFSIAAPRLGIFVDDPDLERRGIGVPPKQAAAEAIN